MSRRRRQEEREGRTRESVRVSTKSRSGGSVRPSQSQNKDTGTRRQRVSSSDTGVRFTDLSSDPLHRSKQGSEGQGRYHSGEFTYKGAKEKEQEESGQGDTLSLKTGEIKRRHSGIFICKTDYKVNNEYETVTRMIGQWEARGKESGTFLDSPRKYSFGQIQENVSSPLKKRRLMPLSPESLHGPPPPPPRPWTRPGTRPPGTPPTPSRRAPWKRPPTKSTRPWRASTSANSRQDDLPAISGSRWPVWRGTQWGTWSSSNCLVRGSSSSGMQTPVYDSAKNTNAKTGSTGSTSTSHASYFSDAMTSSLASASN